MLFNVPIHMLHPKEYLDGIMRKVEKVEQCSGTMRSIVQACTSQIYAKRGEPSLDSGKFHNHCTACCPNFGT